jgi:hypothetical protein
MQGLNIIHKAHLQNNHNHTEGIKALHSITNKPNIIIAYNPTSPMTDHHNTTLSPLDLSSRLTRLQQSTSTNAPTRPNAMSSSDPRRTSIDSFRAPTFSKSNTMSTTSSTRSDFRAAPQTSTHCESVEVGVGEFSKPRVPPRSRRDTGGSEFANGSGSECGEFRYYGRHANQWLFNDFSVTDAMRKGWGKVFDREREREVDWLEKRG